MKIAKITAVVVSSALLSLSLSSAAVASGENNARQARIAAQQEAARIEARQQARQAARAEAARIEARQQARQAARAEAARIEARQQARQAARAEAARIEARQQARQAARAEAARIAARQERRQAARIAARAESQATSVPELDAAGAPIALALVGGLAGIALERRRKKKAA